MPKFKSWLTPLAVGIVALAALVPLYGDPRVAPVTHSEWARLMVRGLDLEGALPGTAPSSQVFAMLSWKNSLTQPAERYARAEGMELLPPDAAGVRRLRAGSDTGEASFTLAVARGGEYRIRLRATGLPEAVGRVELLRLAETTPTESYRVRLPTAPGWIEAGVGHLNAGAWTASVQLPSGAQLESVEVAPPCVSAVEPIGGWVTAAIASTADVAVTLLKALDLEGELEPTDVALEIPAGRFRSLEASTRMVAMGESLDAFKLQAGAGGLQAVVSADVPEAGLYTVSSFGLEGEGQRWNADGCHSAVVCGRQAATEPQWHTLITSEFSAGHHVFTVTLGPGATIERLRLERKKSGGPDYLAAVRKLGFEPGPDGAITRAKAYEALDWLNRRRSQQLLDHDCPMLWERPPLRLADGAPGPAPGPGSVGVPPGTFTPGTLTPPITPPVVPAQDPASRDLP